MAAVALSALFEHLDRGPLLSFVLAGGCNLRCKFCFIEKRGERLNDVVLRPHQYQRFVEDISHHYPLAGIAIVGDEPLIDAAWPSTRTILSAARSRNLPSAIITNGTLLAGRLPELADLRLAALLISLDAVGANHDKLRRLSGAFEATVNGVASLAEYPKLRENTAIASIAFPGRMGWLGDFPPLLKHHGIRRWLVSPLLGFSEERSAHIHPHVAQELKEHLPKLHAQALTAGIGLYVDDVMGALPDDVFNGRHSTTRLVRGLTQALSLLRVAPDGRVMNLENVLNPLIAELPRWDGVETPHHFLERTGLIPICRQKRAA